MIQKVLLQSGPKTKFPNAGERLNSPIPLHSELALSLRRQVVAPFASRIGFNLGIGAGRHVSVSGYFLASTSSHDTGMATRMTSEEGDWFFSWSHNKVVNLAESSTTPLHMSRADRFPDPRRSGVAENVNHRVIRTNNISSRLES